MFTDVAPLESCCPLVGEVTVSVGALESLITVRRTVSVRQAPFWPTNVNVVFPSEGRDRDEDHAPEVSVFSWPSRNSRTPVSGSVTVALVETLDAEVTCESAGEETDRLGAVMSVA